MNTLRKRRRGRRSRRALAALEVVMTTAAIIPGLFFMLWMGFRAMEAFLSLLGTMIGSPLL